MNFSALKIFLSLMTLCLIQTLHAQVNNPIGAIQPGDSIVVFYHVRVNNPLPAGITTISSQGTASGTGFSVSTDDPATGAASDATITFINRIPFFTIGASTTLPGCQDAPASAINALLASTDINTAQTLTWSVVTAPAHGTLNGFPATASSGSNVIPTGLTYQPNAGYNGTDAFVVRVSDGFDASLLTVNVSVAPPVASNTVSGTQTVCSGGIPAQLTGSLPTGGDGTYTYLWESSITGPSSGFGPAAGFNNMQHYQPGAVSQQTWFRRTVFSGACTGFVSTNVAVVSIYTVNSWTGTTGTQWNNASNWTCGVPTSATNAVIPAGTPNALVVNVANAAVNNLTIANGASLSFSAASSALNVYGNITANGTFNALPGSVVFLGSLPQNVPAGPYSGITLNGTGLKTLNGNVSVAGALTFNTGNLALGNHNLTIQSTGTISGGSPSSYLITNGSGSMIYNNIGNGGSATSVNFPIGISAASYTPASLVNVGTPDNFSGRVEQHIYTTYSGNMPTGTQETGNAVDRAWLFTEAAPGGSNGSVTMQWNATDELSGFDHTNCHAIHYNGVSWEGGALGPASGSNPYVKSIVGVTSFSPFGVTSSGTALPLELLSFTGALQDGNVYLYWSTAHEAELNGYHVERSEDGSSFSRVEYVTAKMQAENTYHYQDVAAPARTGLCYYRLAIAGSDGSIHYSQTITVLIPQSSGSSYIYPNPVKDGILSLNVTGKHIQGIRILDAQGRLCSLQKPAAQHVNGSIRRYQIPVKDMPAGMYLLQVNYGDATEEIRFNLE